VKVVNLQLIKFWPSRALGEARLRRGKFFLAPPYYSQGTMFALFSLALQLNLFIYLGLNGLAVSGH